MNDNDLIQRLCKMHDNYCRSKGRNPLDYTTKWKQAADTIAAIPDAPVPDVAALVEALEKLHHAVCGDTGFAECVRRDSGKAYPWPALSEADHLARAALSAWEAANARNRE